LAVTGDFQQAEDVVQEAFIAAWSALPSLTDAAAFPSWLRTIVRRQAFRFLRQKELPTATLAEAGGAPERSQNVVQKYRIQAPSPLFRRSLERTAEVSQSKSREQRHLKNQK
jgi:RNA polymerase sigma factor (sigma-70 family)